MRKRRGYCLVECLVAIGLLGATLSAVAVAMSGMYRCCQRVREESAIELDLQRFAAQFRADAHQALSVKEALGAGLPTPPSLGAGLPTPPMGRPKVSLTAEASGLQRAGSGDPRTAPNTAAASLLLTLTNERSVQYTLRGSHVERVARQAGEPRHRETYRLPRLFTARWQVRKVAGTLRVPSAVVSLVLDPGPVGPGRPLGFQAMQVDAAVGLLRRLPGQPES